MSTLESWNARHFQRYLQQVEQGLHDDACEQRERSSLCHCSKRKRLSEGKTELPEIYFPPPTCGGCGADVEFDGDGFNCPDCKVSWSSRVTDGDKADHFTDDHGDEPFGGEQFGERLIVLATKEL